MKLNITQPDNAGPLKISGTLDIYAAEALRDALAQRVHHQTTLTLDLSEVDGCDVAALQLLYSARKSAEASSEGFAVTTFSQAMINACEALGFALEQLKASNSSN